MEVGRDRGERHGHGPVAADRDGNASQGTVLDSEALQTLPAPGRAAFLVGVSIPTVVPSGDGQYNRQQDQTNASLLSLGGGTRRGNNYVLDGVPITDLHQSRRRESQHRGARGREGPGAHLRRGNGPHRRRRVQHDHEVRARTTSAAPASSRRARCGALANNYFGDEGGTAQAGHQVLPAGRRLRRADREEPDVLLVRRRGLQRRLDARRVDDFRDAGDAERRLLGADHPDRPARDDLRPADASAVPEQHHPGQPDQPGLGGDHQVHAAARRQRVERQQQLHARGGDRQPRARSTRARSSTSSPTRSRSPGSTCGTTPTSPARTTTKSGRTARPGSPIRTTTC